MAHSRTAKKRVRQAARQTIRNRARKNRVRTYVRKVEEAIAGGDRTAAESAFREAAPVLQRGAQKGVMHANTVARKLSRMARRINAL